MASDSAFSRLTPLQQKYVNRQLFDLAYDIVTSFNDENEIQEYVLNWYRSSRINGEAADLLRYCRLVMRVL
jgi:hypothetical protein